ncbi:hypothetical protein K2173_000528 [Erythroxylum novogranatense]|uniref:Pentatricopeptide repeat-containing protein n=1 Tax=Erythroxylum novogranatense TaxID=1862640 RepID=A0AAV8SWP1_9ROSI|nr:hypothetical protein K2173_000528 [Erythroxylum novogranatense]
MSVGGLMSILDVAVTQGVAEARARIFTHVLNPTGQKCPLCSLKPLAYSFFRVLNGLGTYNHLIPSKFPSSSYSTHCHFSFHAKALNQPIEVEPRNYDEFSSHNERESGNESEPPISDNIFKSGSKMGTYKLGDSTFYSIIEKYANLSDFKSLEKVLHRMRLEERAFLERSFIVMFKAYGKAHLPEKAIELFDQMSKLFQCKRTVKSFNSVLNVIIKEGLYHRALEFSNHVVNEKHINISPNVLTFNLIIKAKCKLGLVDDAIEVLREMPVRKCVPDVYTYCTLIDGLCKEGRIDEAVSLLDEMQIDGCFPSTITYNILICGLCRKGDLSRAVKLVDNMFLKGCAPNEVTYNTLIHGLCLKGRLEKAASLLDRMVLSKCVPNEVTYGTIINGLVKEGRAMDGVRILVLMEERGYQVNVHVYSALLSGLFKEGKSEEAMKLFKKMNDNGSQLNTVVYSVLVDGLCREQKPDEAAKILHEMVIKGCRPNAFTYSSLMKGFFDTGDSHKAIELWEDMNKNNCIQNVVCYSVLICGLSKNGKFREAMMVWTQMLRRGCKPDVVTYSSMLHGLCNAGLLEEALKLYHEMLYQEPNSQPDIVTYNILLNSLCKQNCISRAIDLLNTMLDRGCDPDLVTCNIFLTTVREKLDPPQDGRDFLDELVVRLFKRQRVSGASEIMQVMLQKLLPPKASTWTGIIQQLCKTNRIHAAIERCWRNLYADF